LIQENGYFDITGNFPDPHALSLSYHSIVTHSVDNFLLLDENALEAAPDCPMHIKFPSNEGAPLFKKPIPLGPSIPY
jgi:hypothetical protein